MLSVDLRDLARGPVETIGTLTPADPLFEGLDVALAGPLAVTGRLQATGEARFYWHGSFRTTVRSQCRRCLTDLSVPVEGEVGALFSQDPDADDDPDAYAVDPGAGEVDVTVAVREELMLVVPRFALCREDCPGLCPRCGQDLNAGPCGCPPATDPRWQALDALKGKSRA